MGVSCTEVGTASGEKQLVGMRTAGAGLERAIDGQRLEIRKVGGVVVAQFALGIVEHASSLGLVKIRMGGAIVTARHPRLALLCAKPATAAVLCARKPADFVDPAVAGVGGLLYAPHTNAVPLPATGFSR